MSNPPSYNDDSEMDQELFGDLRAFISDEMIVAEARRRYGEITGGQYMAARPHEMAIFIKGAKWARDFKPKRIKSKPDTNPDERPPFP